MIDKLKDKNEAFLKRWLLEPNVNFCSSDITKKNRRLQQENKNNIILFSHYKNLEYIFERELKNKKRKSQNKLAVFRKYEDKKFGNMKQTSSNELKKMTHKERGKKNDQHCWVQYNSMWVGILTNYMCCVKVSIKKKQ